MRLNGATGKKWTLRDREGRKETQHNHFLRLCPYLRGTLFCLSATRKKPTADGKCPISLSQSSVSPQTYSNYHISCRHLPPLLQRSCAFYMILTSIPSCVASTASLASASGILLACRTALAAIAFPMLPRQMRATSRRLVFTHILAILPHTARL